MNSFRDQILNKLTAVYDEAGIEYTESPEAGPDPRTISVLHEGVSSDGNDVISNIFFTYDANGEDIPVPEDYVQGQLFNIIFQVSEEIPEENVTELRLAALRAGYFIPAGSFTVSENENMLFYKLSFLLFEDQGIEKCLDIIDTYYGMALGMCAAVMDDILAVASGDMNAQQMMDAIFERAKGE